MGKTNSYFNQGFGDMKRIIAVRDSRLITFCSTIFCALFFTAVTTSVMAQSGPTSHQHYDIALDELLDEEGVLFLPEGFSGSIDPAGYQLLTDFQQAPKFIQPSESNERWSRGQFGIPGCTEHVFALAAIHGELYLGGSGFDSCGFAVASSIARYNPTTGEFSPLGSGLNGTVLTLAVMGADLYVGGSFREAGAKPASYIAVYDTTQVGDAGWSALGSGLGDSLINNVFSLAVIGTDLYVGGDFTIAGGKPASRIAVFDTRQDGDAGWSALGSGVSGRDVFTEVRSLEVNGSNLYVGGEFTQAGQISASRIAVYDTTQEGDAAWFALGSGVAGEVEALKLIGTDLYVGGRIALAGGTLARNIAVYDTLQSGDAGWSGLGSGINFTVFTLTAIDTNLFVGGSFTEAGGVSANSIAVFDTRVIGDDGWSALGPGVDGSVRSVAAIGSDLYVGGIFSFAGNQPAHQIAKFDMAQNSDQSWSALGSGLNGAVWALEVIDSALYLAGRFQRAGNISANGVAVYKPNQTDGFAWSSLGDGIDGAVFALESNGSNLYVGGDFTTAGGMPANNIAVFDTNSTGNSGWTPLGSGTNNTVHSLAVNDSELYVGGRFTTAGTNETIGIASFDLAQSGDAGWFTLGSGLNGSVFALEFIGSDLYVGGQFSQAGGLPANDIARYDTTISSDDAWSTLGSGLSFQGRSSPPIFSSVSVLESIGHIVYVGGLFDTAGGQNANHIALYDTTQVGDSGWAVLGSGVSGAVGSMTAIGPDLYVGGRFFRAGGQTVSYIAVYDTNQSGDAAWSSLGEGISGISVSDTVRFGTDLFVGGSFWLAGGSVNGNLARLRGNPTSVGVPVAGGLIYLLLGLVLLITGFQPLRKATGNG